MTLVIDEECLLKLNMNDWIYGFYDKLVSGDVKPVFEETPSRLRRLTINETKRIHIFPDDYVFCGVNTIIYKQIGNAVPRDNGKTVVTVASEYIIFMTKNRNNLSSTVSRICGLDNA